MRSRPIRALGRRDALSPQIAAERRRRDTPGILRLAYFVLITHTKYMNNNEAQIAELDEAIAKATENIARAVKARLTRFAQDTRRQRRALIAKRDELTAR